MNNWNRIGKPIVVLSLICIVVTAALAATNEVTAPIIEEARIEAENAARLRSSSAARSSRLVFFRSRRTASSVTAPRRRLPRHRQSSSAAWDSAPPRS